MKCITARIDLNIRQELINFEKDFLTIKLRRKFNFCIDELFENSNATLHCQRYLLHQKWHIENEINDQLKQNCSYTSYPGWNHLPANTTYIHPLFYAWLVVSWNTWTIYLITKIASSQWNRISNKSAFYVPAYCLEIDTRTQSSATRQLKTGFNSFLAVLFFLICLRNATEPFQH